MTANLNAHGGVSSTRSPATAPNYDPCNAGPGSDTDVLDVSLDGRRCSRGRIAETVSDGGRHTSGSRGPTTCRTGGSRSRGTRTRRAGSRRHLRTRALGGGRRARRPLGPAGARRRLGDALDRAVRTAGRLAGDLRPGRVQRRHRSRTLTGKDCNVFHGDYTGLAVDSLDRVHVVWTGLNRTGDVPAGGLLHRGRARRLRAGRDVRAARPPSDGSDRRIGGSGPLEGPPIRRPGPPRP